MPGHSAGEGQLPPGRDAPGHVPQQFCALWHPHQHGPVWGHGGGACLHFDCGHHPHIQRAGGDFPGDVQWQAAQRWENPPRHCHQPLDYRLGAGRAVCVVPNPHPHADLRHHHRHFLHCHALGLYYFGRLFQLWGCGQVHQRGAACAGRQAAGVPRAVFGDCPAAWLPGRPLGGAAHGVRRAHRGFLLHHGPADGRGRQAGRAAGGVQLHLLHWHHVPADFPPQGAGVPVNRSFRRKVLGFY